MARVFIGVDPHKLSATIEVVDDRETVLATGRFGTDKAGYAAMRKHVASFPDRVWAVEGSNGAGRPLAQRLLADGEHVVDVPAKLSARARALDTGHNRKTDPHDAHAVAVVAVRTPTLRVLAYDVQHESLRLLVDRRAELTRARIQTVNRVHRLLSELVPGQRKRDITTGQAKTILATVKPRDLAGKTRRRLAAEQTAELVAIEKKIKALTRELKEMVLATGSTLMDLPGVGPVVAARTLADTGDVTRFADRNKYASWTGTAPIEASSGEVVRHRLSRAGNRRMNHMIHIAAATQIRLDTPGRAHYRRKIAAGKSRREAMRSLKRRISDALYRQLSNDAASGVNAGPGGHSGAALQSSAAGLHPHTGTSDQPLMTNTAQTTASTRVPMDSLRNTALVAGIFYLMTMVSIPTLALYGPVKSKDFIIGSGADTGALLGCFLEVIVALAGIGTAVTLYPVVKRQNEGMALGFVASRTLEAAMLFTGVASILSLVTLHQDLGTAAGADAASLATVGASHVATYHWAFTLGGSLMPGINAILLGTLLYRSGLVPRVLPMIGLIGAPLHLTAVVLTMFGVIDRVGSVALIAALPIFVWELSLGIYLIVKGFKPCPITEDIREDARPHPIRELVA